MTAPGAGGDALAARTLVRWRVDAEAGGPPGRRSPDPARWAPIGFPPPWPDRPWIYGVMVASANGVVAWRRAGADDDPVRGILGDPDRPARHADRLLVRFLRCFGDVAVGARTIREQPGLLQTPQEPGEPARPELYRFRLEQGLSRQPRHVVYSLFGRLPVDHPVFTTPGIEAIVVTTEVGAAELARRGARLDPRRLVVEPLLEPGGLGRAHERLSTEHAVRYLDCEGGVTVLRALREAGVLDEVFLTRTDVVVDTGAHEGILTMLDLSGARLVAEGGVDADPGWVFQRWRLNERG